MEPNLEKRIGYVFVIDGSSYKEMYIRILSDVAGLNNCSIVVDQPNRNSILKKVLLKKKLSELTKGGLDLLYLEHNNLEKAVKKSSFIYEHTVIVFFNAALNYNPYLAGNLSHYRKKYKNITYVLFYLDIIDSGVSYFANYLRSCNIFDLVYTVDANDSERDGIHLWNTIFSKNTSLLDIVTTNDIYFCGADKGRAGVLKYIIDLAFQHDVRISMDVIGSDARDVLGSYGNSVRIREDGEIIEYNEVLKRELTANCLLDIVQKNQKALTLRPYEAVVYNRKLLTNNKGVFDFSFFHPQFIQYFEKPEEIDWDWVKDTCKVDYGYTNEFSPLLLVDDICKRLFYN